LRVLNKFPPKGTPHNGRKLSSGESVSGKEEKATENQKKRRSPVTQKNEQRVGPAKRTKEEIKRSQFGSGGERKSKVGSLDGGGLRAAGKKGE